MLGVSRIGVSGQPSHVAFVVVLRASTHSLTLSLVLVAPILRVRLGFPPEVEGSGDAGGRVQDRRSKQGKDERERGGGRGVEEVEVLGKEVRGGVGWGVRNGGGGGGCERRGRSVCD